MSSDPVVAVDVGPSGEKAKKIEETTKDAFQAESEGIFTGRGSFEKL